MKVLALSLALVAAPAFAQCVDDRIMIQTHKGPQTFSVEVADTWWRRARGLMGRDELADNSGMLFLYDKAEPRTFWMMMTPLDLDIIFFNRAGRIVQVVRGAKANSTDPVPSTSPAIAVLEIMAGSISGQSLQIGDHARHRIFGNCLP